MALRIRDVSGWIYISLWAFVSTVALYAQPYAYVANKGNNSLAIVNVPSGTVSASVTVPAGPDGVAVTPNGSTAYVASSTYNNVSVVSLSSKSIIATIAVGTAPGAMTVSPNGALLYVADVNSAQVTAISTATNTVTATISVGLHPTSVAFSPDSSRAYVTSLYMNTLYVINTSTNAVTSFSTGAGPSAVAATPDGQHVYVTCVSANAVYEYTTTGSLVASISGFDYPNAIAITPNGATAFVVNGNGSSVSAINLSSNSLVATASVGNLPMSVAISTDGTQAYVANESGYSMSIVSATAYSLVRTVGSVGVYPVAVAAVPAVASLSSPAPSPPAPPPPCSYTVTPPSNLTIPSAGGSLSFGVQAGSGCAWSASGPGWATASWSTGSGSGNGTATMSVSANSGVPALSGSITIEGTSFTVTQSGVAFAGVRVNCGGAAFTDSNGNYWQADTGRNTSMTASAIAGADIPAVYQKEAYSSSGLTYSLAVPVGTFTVKLRFAEIYLVEAGQRVVDIYINGALALGNFDILAQAGIGPNTAYNKVFTGVSSNGQVTIQISPATTGSIPKLSGIEIY
jgi:YVTN family beta-propeller protein